MTGQRIEIAVLLEGTTNVLTANGDLDHACIGELAEAVRRIEEDGKDCVANLRGATYFDTECLKLLLGLRVALINRGKSLRVAVPREGAAARFFEAIRNTIDFDWS